ncbi:Sugar or nucleoside kinase, ribokinase family [Alkalispirochaeta americana]|uniref:Sugar or nucleoside kinase, ribokinase family n=1 Tax=Alkalispirochaeta americana TaxID=159291 RepID=A0A1N6N8Z7_9SPIO|nr:carbohydrate kinase family protein [Alkalispirochaeta americana]SIP88525.1 Sugar or nucleoside kinase, ribokinase family [Alkalispirochaeta americana]
MDVTIAGIGAPYLEYPRKACQDPSRGILGGSVAVALLHAAQLLRPRGLPVSLYGLRGNDPAGNRLVELLSRTSIHWDHFIQTPGETPQMHFARNNQPPREETGLQETRDIPEATYTPGVTEKFCLNHIPETFYHHTITSFEATGTLAPLLPDLHKAVDRARSAGALTIVHSASDTLLPREGSLLGDLPLTCAATELLLLTEEQALILTGQPDAPAAAENFLHLGVSAVIIVATGGDIFFRTAGGTFLPLEATLTTQPAPAYWEPFTGALAASLAEQLDQGEQACDLHQAVRWGIATSEYCRTQGSALSSEHRPRDKRERIREIFLTIS